MPHVIIKESFLDQYNLSRNGSKNQKNIRQPNSLSEETNRELEHAEEIQNINEPNKEQIKPPTQIEQEKKRPKAEILRDAYDKVKCERDDPRPLIEQLNEEIVEIENNKTNFSPQFRKKLSYNAKILKIQEKIANVFIGGGANGIQLEAWLKALMMTKPAVAAGLLKAILPKQIELDKTVTEKKAPLIITVNQQNNYGENPTSNIPDKVLDSHQTLLLGS